MLIIGCNNSKISLHFCKDYRIFHEGEWEVKDDGDALIKQQSANSNNPDAGKKQRHKNTRMMAAAEMAVQKLLSINNFDDKLVVKIILIQNSEGAFASLSTSNISTKLIVTLSYPKISIDFDKKDRKIFCEGEWMSTTTNMRGGAIKWIVSISGFGLILSLIGQISLIGLIGLINLISQVGLNSFICLGICLIGLGWRNDDFSLISLDFVLSAHWLINFIGLSIEGLISLINLSGINGLIGKIGLIGFVGLRGFGLISLVGLSLARLIGHISLTGLIGDIGFISLFGYVGLVGHIGHNSLAGITGLSLFHGCLSS
jgi:hypothetical protein